MTIDPNTVQDKQATVNDQLAASLDLTLTRVEALEADMKRAGKMIMWLTTAWAVSMVILLICLVILTVRAKNAFDEVWEHPPVTVTIPLEQSGQYLR